MVVLINQTKGVNKIRNEPLKDEIASSKILDKSKIIRDATLVKQLMSCSILKLKLVSLTLGCAQLENFPNLFPTSRLIKHSQETVL